MRMIDMSNVNLLVSNEMIKMLCGVANLSKEEVLFILFDLAQIPVSRVIMPGRKSNWASKNMVFPNTPIVLRVKAISNRLDKDLDCTYKVYEKRPVEYKALDVENMMTEKLLLGY